MGRGGVPRVGAEPAGGVTTGDEAEMCGLTIVNGAVDGLGVAEELVRVSLLLVGGRAAGEE